MILYLFNLLIKHSWKKTQSNCFDVLHTSFRLEFSASKSFIGGTGLGQMGNMDSSVANALKPSTNVARVCSLGSMPYVHQVCWFSTNLF